MPEIYSKTIVSEIDSMWTCIKEIMGLLDQKIKLDQQDVFDINLVLEEAITNAVKHGNKSQSDLNVEVSVALEGSTLTMSIRDQGEGFDFNNIPNPREEDRLMKTSGRGIFLMRKIMDDLEFLDSGREIRIIKEFSEDKKR